MDSARKFYRDHKETSVVGSQTNPSILVVSLNFRSNLILLITQVLQYFCNIGVLLVNLKASLTHQFG